MASNDPLAWLPALLQTTDAQFPTGAYAHSLGFEELARLTDVKGESGLRDFVAAHVIPALERFELPYLRFAFEAANLAALCEADVEISACKLAREGREASVQVGRRRLAALRAVNPGREYDEFAEAVTAGRACGNHLTVCAIQARVERHPLEAALMAYAYQSVSGVCSAALKVIRIGQEGCQRVIRFAVERIPGAIAVSMDIARDEAGYFDPMLEIASMRHEFANERLFIS